MNSSSTKCYAVLIGHQPGIYEDWHTASQQVTGYPGSMYKRFSTYEEAEQYIRTESSTNAAVEPTTTVAPSSRVGMLTLEQKSVIHQLLQGKNIALLGAAGCGKSFLLSIVYTEYPAIKKRYDNQSQPNSVSKLPRIQICAMTGCAALLLGNKAKTLHSWAGIGLGKGTVSELYTKIRRNTKAMRHWLCTDILVIDEVSMLTAELLDKLNELAKRIRSNKKPFGGMQLMLVGDFYQLPPVSKGEDVTEFAFESKAWKEIIDVTVELTHIQRQKDEVFQNILKEARIGSLSRSSCAILEECQARNWKEHKIRPTLIFPRRAEVEMINTQNLKALTGRRYHYKPRLVYDGKMPQDFTEKDEQFQQALKMFDSNAAYAVDLELALHAQVMLVANILPEMGLVNGSRGVVVDFCPQTELPIVEFVNGTRRVIGYHAWPIEDYEFISRSQIPLRLAYSITVHKCQGSTLDAALIDVGSGIFEYGQAYVALSRVRSLDALYIYHFDPSAFRVHPKVVAFYRELSTVCMDDQRSDLLDMVLCDTNDERKQDDSHSNIIPSKDIYDNIVSTTPTVNELEPAESLDIRNEATEVTNWLYDFIPDDWKHSLQSCQGKLMELSQFLSEKEYLPSKDHVWKALALTSLHSIKVVILGQDPYPTPGNAVGLAFSVSENTKPIPASLKNMYKELSTDIPDWKMPTHGNLESWAKQGILLLNTVLTVEPGNPQSHSKMGWEEVTDQILRSIAAQTEGTIFVLWGKSAQAKKKVLDLFVLKNKHRILESAHPSPLSAHRGFFGSKPFSTINAWLQEAQKEPINWQVV